MKKVMCFGVFDGLHQGHLSYFRQAKKFGDYLLVIIARDRTVKKLKGRPSYYSEEKRLAKVKKLKTVDTAVLGQLRDRLGVIKKYKPNVICLGYDQQANLEELRKVFKGEIVRAKPYKAQIFKSSKLNKEL